jgi:hypothetical protein
MSLYLYNSDIKHINTNMATFDETTYVTGSGIKLDDFKRILGEDIFTKKIEVPEIQGDPFDVSVDKIRKIYDNQGSRPVGGEDTSFGVGKLASVVKDFVEECKLNGSDLYAVMRALAPKRQYFDYRSIFAYKDGLLEAFFECCMKCEICPRTADGMIDPFAIPIEYTLTQTVNGVRTVLCENQPIENPHKLSIAQQPDMRHLIHPRYFSIGAYKSWRESM